MPSKKKKQDGGSKKAEQKRKQQVIEDRTFGMKNKNKSKKVQQQIEGIKKSVMNTGNRRERQAEEQRKKQKAQMKARKKAEKDELNALFGEALLAINKKKTTSQKDGKTEAKGRDADDAAAKKGTSRAMKMMYQMDAKEMEDRLREDVSVLNTNVIMCFFCQSPPNLNYFFFSLSLQKNVAKLCSDNRRQDRVGETKEGRRIEKERKGYKSNSRNICCMAGSQTKEKGRSC